MTTPALDTLLCSRPASLTLAHAEACLPTVEVDPEWQAKHDTGTLPEGFAGLVGSMRTVWPEEMLTEQEARWILAMREHLSWRSLADFVMGDGNQITGMHLEEAGRRALDLDTPSTPRNHRSTPSIGETHQGTTWFITRHPGAREWARQEGVAIDRLVTHLDPEDVQPGDTVLGTLPVNLAAEICARGARYFHLSLELPADWRGRELSAADMRRFGAKLEEYRVNVAETVAP